MPIGRRNFRTIVGQRIPRPPSLVLTGDGPTPNLPIQVVAIGAKISIREPNHKAMGKTVAEDKLLRRITVNPEIFGGKPVVRGRRIAVEHILGMLAAGDDFDTLLEGYPWLKREDILACLIYAHRLVQHERVEPVSPAA